MTHPAYVSNGFRFLATTGLDPAELADTLAFNERQERANDQQVPLHLQGPAAARAARGTFGGALLPEGTWRILTVGPDRRELRLRIFVPPVVNGVHLHIHGGGGVVGGAGLQDERLWQQARDARVAVVSVEYRLAPEDPYPAGQDDCEEAALWLIAHAEREFGTRRLTIGGESAGARLAVVTLLRLRDRHGLGGAFRAAQLTFGGYELAAGMPSARTFGERNCLVNTPILEWFQEQVFGGLSEEARRSPDISPVYADLTGLPSARFVVGTMDPLLDDTLLMAQRWRAAGNPAELTVVAEAWHGFTLYPIAVARRELAAQDRFIAAAVSENIAG
ncbi:alpha/beta hydrolase fold domain-containing protein [Streptomyces sp. NPDC050485]|uniref:alpha/beta hydrolase fold domain-containing protein n=1 Tax=Streptomyces sp. NPDC050485 TaxID=3365617 RepID=UPI00378F397E